MTQNWFESKNTENTQFDTSIYQTIIDELVVCEAKPMQGKNTIGQIKYGKKVAM